MAISLLPNEKDVRDALLRDPRHRAALVNALAQAIETDVAVRSAR